MYRYRIFKASPLLLTFALCGCIHSPLPGGTQAELFHWDDQNEALSTREGVASEEFSGFFDGDLDWREILQEQVLLDLSSDQPYMMKSCHAGSCYHAVLFPGDFVQDKNGLVAGFASLSGLSTLMYHEVKSLPADQVKTRLDELAQQVLGENLDSRNYSTFIKLDAQRFPKHANTLSRDSLESAAATEVEGGTTLTIAQLLNAAALRTSQLHAGADFVFSDAWTLKIDVDISRRINSGGYLMICGEFEPDGDSFLVAYDNCQLKTALVGGRYTGDLKMTSGNSVLLVSIMRLDDPENLEQIIWVRGNQDDALTLR